MTAEPPFAKRRELFDPGFSCRLHRSSLSSLETNRSHSSSRTVSGVCRANSDNFLSNLFYPCVTHAFFFRAGLGGVVFCFAVRLFCCFAASTQSLLQRRCSHAPCPGRPGPRRHSRSIPHRGSAASGPQGGDARSLAGHPPKESPHCCRVTSVVFSDACSYSTTAGHHVVFPLLTTG